MTSCQPSPVRRQNTAASAASRALRTTSSVRLPVAGISIVSGVENSRTGSSWRRREALCGRLPPTEARLASGSLRPRASVAAESGVRAWPNRPPPRSWSTPPPAAVMAVIADFPAYPEWAKGVKTADVARARRRRGRPGRARSSSTSTSRRSRTSTRSPTTGTATTQVTWTLVEGKMLRALDGAYVAARPRRRQHRGHLPARPRRLDPADRHAQAQGREDPDRHRAEGPEEARRVARLSRRSWTVRILLFTGKGGVGKSTVAAGTAALAAAPGHRTLVLSTDAAHSLADAFGAPVGSEPTEVAELPVRAAGRRPAAVRAVLGRDPALPAVGARRGRRRPGRGRGADRHPRRRGGAGAARAARCTRSPASGT